MDILLRDIERAAQRLKPILHHTELDCSTTFSKIAGADIYLKCENRQKTGSFKIRGASNKIAVMTENGKNCPVVASSAGNHAQGVAYAASRFGIPATIVMPLAAPIAKVQATEGYGAKVVLAGECYDDAYAKACEICRDEGAEFLHPYNDPDVIAGQATLGLEVLSDLPYVDAVIVPAGGGGLLSGIASAIKQINPRVKVYGVQAEGADAIARSFAAKSYITTEYASTIADGIAVKTPGDITVDIINRYADGVVTVSESEIANAILLLMERSKQIVEPAGATSLAAALSHKLDIEGKRVICIMSGGNIDVSFVQNIIERGLVARHRIIKFVVTLLDRPGSLGKLVNLIAEERANVLAVEHDKLNSIIAPNETKVHVACEVGGEAHGNALIKKLRDNGFEVTVEVF